MFVCIRSFVDIWQLTIKIKHNAVVIYMWFAKLISSLKLLEMVNVTGYVILDWRKDHVCGIKIETVTLNYFLLWSVYYYMLFITVWDLFTVVLIPGDKLVTTSQESFEEPHSQNGMLHVIIYCMCFICKNIFLDIAVNIPVIC